MDSSPTKDVDDKPVTDTSTFIADSDANGAVLNAPDENILHA